MKSRKVVNLLSLLVMVSVNIITPFSYADVEDGLFSNLVMGEENLGGGDGGDYVGTGGTIEYEQDSSLDIQDDEPIFEDSSFLKGIKQNEISLMSLGDPQLDNREYDTITITRPSSLTDADGPESFVIMDRNLGAVQAGTSTTSYGYHYQWGNNYGFSMLCFTNGCTDSVTDSAVDVAIGGAIYDESYDNNGYYGENFIKDETFGNTYWKNGVQPNGLWGGSGDSSANNWGLDTIQETAKNRQGPCPDGRHVPSVGEWRKVMEYRCIRNSTYCSNTGQIGFSSNLLYFKTTTQDGNFMNYIKLPKAGMRTRYQANMGNPGSYGYYWTSTPGAQLILNVPRNSDGSPKGQATYRNNGHSVRCFQNLYVAPQPQQSNIVTYDANGHGTAPSSVEVVSGGKLTEPTPVPTAEGYTFLGWYKEAGCTNVWDFDNDVVTGDITLYAKWEIIDITPPTIIFTDPVSDAYVQIDTVTVDWGDASVMKYMYTTSGTCPETSGNYTTTTSTSFNQTTEEYNGNYICLYAEDTHGNSTTLRSANTIHVDTTRPIITFDKQSGVASKSHSVEITATDTLSKLAQGEDEWNTATYSLDDGYKVTYNGKSYTLAFKESGKYMYHRWGNNYQGNTTTYNGVQNNNRWGGSGDIAPDYDTGNPRSERLGPCKNGRHVPSAGEWMAIVIARCHLDSNSCTSSDISEGNIANNSMLASAFRSSFNMASNEDYWSSSPSLSYKAYIFSTAGGVYTTFDSSRSNQLNIRCLKNDTSAGGSSAGSLKYRWQASSDCSSDESDYTSTSRDTYSDGDTTATATVTTDGLGDGSYYLCVLSGSAVDNAGNTNETTQTSGVFVIDNTPPVNGTFTINSDATYTTGTSVTLTIICPSDAGEGTVEVAYGNTANPDNWTGCTASISYTLIAGDGEKTVYMRFKDGLGNTTSDATDTIILDTTAPTCEITGNPENWTSQDVTLTVTMTDTNEDSNGYKWDNGNYGSTNTLSVTENGLHTGYVRDLAGNEASCSEIVTKIDKAYPVSSIDTTATLKSGSQTATLSCTDSVGITKYYRGNLASPDDSDFTILSEPEISFSTGKTVTNPGTYYLICKDGAGNTSNSDSKTYHTYTVHNMLNAVDKDEGTYDTTNYPQDTTATYLAPAGTTITFANVYSIPTYSAVDQYLGYTTSASGEPSNTVSAELNSNSDYYFWFDRVKYSLNLVKGTGIETIYYKINGAEGYVSTSTSTGVYMKAGSDAYAYAVASNGYSYSATSFANPWTSSDVTEAHEFSPVVDMETYTITYHLNGGTQENPKTGYTIEDETFTLVNPTKDHYIFAGWTGSNGNELQTTVTITQGSKYENLEYYANWYEDFNDNGQNDADETKYIVTYTDGVDGEEVFADEVTSNILSGSTTPVFGGDTTRSGYVFSGWNPAVAGTVTTDVTYTAIWGEDKNHNGIDDSTELVAITFNAGNHGKVNNSTKYTTDKIYLPGYNNYPAAPSPTADNGWKFVQWSPAYKVGEMIPLSGAELEYTAQWNSNGGGSSSSGGGGGGGGSTKPDTPKEEQKPIEDTPEETLQKEDKQESSLETQDDKQNTKDDQQTDQGSDKSSEGQDNRGTKSPGNSYTKEQEEAYEFARSNGITTKSTIQEANMNGNLTRIQMAKMLSQYAINVLGKEPDTSKEVKFNDVTAKRDADYDNGVTLAYQLGIMGQNMKNNKFRPNDEVTRGEFVTALSRLLYNTSDGEYKSTSKYYTHHIEKLEKEGIITKTDPKMKERRGYVMIMLKRSVES